ncbi:MAG TPA: glycoside hydrolase family 25 protein [Candidatus Agathobaculum merdigallinarum]|nr:glycoside hydrolase family 25 protein [Candidatus Agathobaculum merdigallinarum]
MSQPLYPRRPQRRTKKKSKRLALLILLLLLLIAAAAAGVIIYHAQHSIIPNELGLRNIQVDQTLLQTGGAFYAYENSDDNTTVSVGIDVSTYQGTIDWQAVKDAGIDYVIVRAAYRGYETGKIVPDDLYEQNIRGAADVGLHVGVYLYSQALSEHEAEEEADYLLSLIEGLPVDYPVVYDQEEYTADKARTDGLTGEQATLNALAFCRRVHEAGYIPMIYTNNDWATTMYDMERLDHYPVWYADYTSTPTLPGGFAMWQYTDSGQVPGITGPVDLNLLFLPIP